MIRSWTSSTINTSFSWSSCCGHTLWLQCNASWQGKATTTVCFIWEKEKITSHTSSSELSSWLIFFLAFIRFLSTGNTLEYPNTKYISNNNVIMTIQALSKFLSIILQIIRIKKIIKQASSTWTKKQKILSALQFDKLCKCNHQFLTEYPLFPHRNILFANMGKLAFESCSSCPGTRA